MPLPDAAASNVYPAQHSVWSMCKKTNLQIRQAERQIQGSREGGDWILSVQGLPIHLDGARVFNAAVVLGVDVKAITGLVTSVQFCLSKVNPAGRSAPEYT